MSVPDGVKGLGVGAEAEVAVLIYITTWRSEFLLG